MCFLYKNYYIVFSFMKNPFENYFYNSVWMAALKSPANLVNLLSGGHLLMGR